MFKHSLSLRLASVVCLVIASILAISGFLLAHYVGQSMTALTQAEMQQVIQSTRNSIHVYNQELENSANHLSAVFANTFAGDFTLDNSRTVTVAQQRVPMILNNNQDISGDFSTVDDFAKATGGNATIFVRRGDDFVRVITSVKKEDGSRAIGTLLDRKSPAYGLNIQGQVFNGKVELFGRSFITNYTPLKDQQGNVIGIRYIGISFAQSLESLKAGLQKTQIGTHGHLYAINNSTGKQRGQFVIEPKVGNLNTHQALIEQMLKQQQGNLSEQLQLDGKTAEQWHFYFDTVPELDWLVVAAVPQKQLMTTHQFINDIMLLINIIMVIVVGIILIFISKRMVGKPLQQAVVHLQTIAKGDYSAEIEINREDETGTLLHALKSMQQQVKQMVLNLSETAINLASASTQLSKVSQQVASGSQQQTDAALSMASTIEQLTVNIDNLSHHAEDSKAISQSSNEIAVQGATVIQQAGTEMQRILRTVRGASDEISVLGELSGQISSIIQVIRDIADQTNLLALNAAIEAARAGEQGRGFAVVADEVRALAGRTSSSVQEITQMIEQIQNKTAGAVSAMSEGVKQVESGATLSAQAGESIHEIQQGALQVMNAFEEISSMLNEQANASSEVAKNVENIVQMAGTNSTAINDVASSANHLQTMATDLNGLIKQFKTD